MCARLTFQQTLGYKESSNGNWGGGGLSPPPSRPTGVLIFTPSFSSYVALDN